MTQQVPESWAVAPLAAIADVQLGKMLSAKARGGHGTHPYLRNINVRWHRIDVSDVLEMDFDSREVGKYQLQAGDVLVCEGGEPGRAAIWREQLPGALYQKALHRVRFRDGVLDPRLFTHYLELAATTGRLARRFTGSTIKHLPREAFLGLEVPIPPLVAQDRIITALEEHLSGLDAAVAGLERARANCARLRAANMRAAVNGSLLDGRAPESTTAGPERWTPAVPSGWIWSTVDQLAEAIEYGTSTRTDNDTTGVPVLRMGNIVDGRLAWDNLKYLPQRHSEFPDLLLRPGDVLFNRTNSPELVGKTAVYLDGAPQASFASYLLRVRLGPRMLPAFLSAYINSAYGRAWVASVVSQQVGQANVNGTKLRALPVPVPPLDEQLEIVAELDRRLAVTDRTVAEIDVQLARAKRLRQSILKRAFEGKLVPQEPDDEPADALLERIRAGRASAAPARRPARGRATSPR